jgi:uncharacterized protein
MTPSTTSRNVLVDTGAWIALAIERDPYNARAKEALEELRGAGRRLLTTIPIVLETFTFLERNTSRDLALRWKDSVSTVPMHECRAADVTNAWTYFQRKDLHKLSAVDATSFAIMKRLKIRTAFTFDSHFATAGFHVAG